MSFPEKNGGDAASAKAVTGKRPYTPPVLKPIGTVRELTLKAGSVSDGNPGPFTTKTSATGG